MLVGADKVRILLIFLKKFLAHSGPSPSPPLEDDSCKNLSDGIHIGSPCSPNFMVCKKGRVFKGHCGKGLLFNLENLRCDYEEKITRCFPSTSKKQKLSEIVGVLPRVGTPKKGEGKDAKGPLLFLGKNKGFKTYFIFRLSPYSSLSKS